MPDSAPPRSIFPGLLQQATPPMQVTLAELHAELSTIGQAFHNATPDTLEEVINAHAARLEPLLAASAMAVEERVGAAVRAYGPIIGEALGALAIRAEIQRFMTIFSLDVVSLCPAAAQARAEADDDDDDDNDEDEE